MKTLYLWGGCCTPTRGAFGALRVMVNLNQMGEAAGIAAYCCVNENKAVQAADTVQVRRLLKDGGSLII